MDPLFESFARVLIGLAGGSFSQVAFQGSGRRFRKEVLPEGTYHHPSTGRVHRFTRDDLAHIALQSNKNLTAGNQCPFPDGHKFESLDNMGFWSGFEVAPSTSYAGKQGLFAVVDVPMDVHADKLGKTIKSVSVLLEKEVKLSNGDKLAGPVCTHVCATNYPVVPGQSDFVAFSNEFKGLAGVDLFLSGETGDQPMDLTKLLIAALGLQPNATPEQIGAALNSKLGENKSLADQVAKLSVDNKAMLDDLNKSLGMSRPVPKTDREIKLERELVAIRGTEAASLLEAYVKEGRLSKAESDIFSTLLAVGEVTVVPFGKEAPEALDVSKSVRTFLAALPAKRTFDPSTLSQRGTGEELVKAKAEQEAKAAWFTARGYTVAWNADRSSFSVDRPAVKKG